MLDLFVIDLDSHHVNIRRDRFVTFVDFNSGIYFRGSLFIELSTDLL